MGEQQATIGVNYLSSDEPIWFTMADCIASKILTGETPKVLKAVSFEPGAQQEGLTPIRIAGDSDYEVDPATDDFYRRLIDLRSSIKAKMKSAGPEEREALDALQLALKILANATSYGIFVELIVEEANRKQSFACFGNGNEGFPLDFAGASEREKIEKPGSFFHPLLATLITGAARLLLATVERLSADRLKTYAQALSSYHLRPESKFENADFYDRGPTRRRHVRTLRVEYIGKESNRWEEQYYLGLDEGADIAYGSNPSAPSGHLPELKSLVAEFGERVVARQINVSRNTLRRILSGGNRSPSRRTVRQIAVATHALTACRR
jgi:hypothetical protein